MATKQFYPHHILPADPIKRSGETFVEASNGVFLSGSTTTSSILHLALNHINQALLASEVVYEDSKGKGKGREQKSEIAREPHVLILTPDREGLRDALSKENDLSLFGKGNTTESIRLLEKVEIKYLPTVSAFKYGLMTLYAHGSPPSAHEAFAASGSKLKSDPSYLPISPTLVILHDPSIYLSETSTPGGTEAYASLLALFQSTFSSFSPQPNLIVHDRKAHELELSILPSHLRRSARKRPRVEPNDEEGGEVEAIQKTTLQEIASFFFDWVGTVEHLPHSPSSVLDETERRYHLTLRQSQPNKKVRDSEIRIEYWVREKQVEIESSEGAEMETGIRIERTT